MVRGGRCGDSYQARVVGHYITYTWNEEKCVFWEEKNERRTVNKTENRPSVSGCILQNHDRHSQVWLHYYICEHEVQKLCYTNVPNPKNAFI